MDPSQVFEVAASLCFQLAIVVSATFALDRWLDDARAGCRLWTLCFVGIVGLIAAAVLLPHRRLFDFPLIGDSNTVLAIITWQATLTSIMMAIWLMGVAFLTIQRLWQCWKLSQFLQHCDALDAETWKIRFGLDLAPNVRLLVSDKVHGPFCWQLHQPTIVLSKQLVDESDATLRHVLLHEISHLATQHPMQHFLQGVCSTIFWFHPAMWAAAAGAHLNREFLCDEVAATSSGRISDYLRTLARVAECCGTSSSSNAPIGTLAFKNPRSDLLKRSDRLVNLASCPHHLDGIRVALTTVALAVLIVLIQQVWLPTNAMASSRSHWSPWPSWTANIFHNTLGVSVRDYESYESRSQIHEWIAECEE